MVEGHSVHRVASRFFKKFVGSVFVATSPNGRFTEGAAAINRKKFTKIEAVGKNLFAFFGKNRVVHIHFGMSGRWAIFSNKDTPEHKSTTRLVLTNRRLGLTAHLSAMTVKFGNEDMYKRLRSKLGEDPLNSAADHEALRMRVQASKKSISRLLMDQSYFAGVGNIYRAEILFCARINPGIIGSDITDEEFNRIWKTSVKLMQTGFQTGRITSLTKSVAKTLGDVNRRRYVYNQTNCIVCKSRISSWKENSRTVWACLECQSKIKKEQADNCTRSSSAKRKQFELLDSKCAVFYSRCASEPFELRRHSAKKLRVRELRNELTRFGLSASGKKAELVKRLESHLDGFKIENEGTSKNADGQIHEGELFDSFDSQRAPVSPFKIRRRSVQNLRVHELRDELNRLGYQTSGKKADLVHRLQAHRDDMQEHTADYDESESSASVHGYNKRLRKRT